MDKPPEVLVEDHVWLGPTLTCQRHDTCQGGRHAETLPHVSNLIGGKTAKPVLQNTQFQ